MVSPTAELVQSNNTSIGRRDDALRAYSHVDVLMMLVVSQTKGRVGVKANKLTAIV